MKMAMSEQAVKRGKQEKLPLRIWSQNIPPSKQIVEFPGGGTPFTFVFPNLSRPEKYLSKHDEFIPKKRGGFGG